MRFAATRYTFLALGFLAGEVRGFSQTASAAAPQQVAAEEPVERLENFSVVAGRIPIGASPGAILNTVEVLSTPGGTADINRSLQTFPGVQQVDEGNALFVRGGDSSETATLVNGIRYPSATRLRAPMGSFSGSLDPMQAKTITFLNGGLSAQYGNVLSGIVDLATRGAPTSSGTAINVGLGALGVTENVALPERTGFRVTGVKSSTAPIIGLNGTRHDYEEAPNGHDLSVAGGWNYRTGGEVRTYLLEQKNEVGLRIDSPELKGIYHSRVLSRVGTLSWNDQFGKWRWMGSAGGSSLLRGETTSLGNISTRNSQKQLVVSTTCDVSGQVALSAGAEFVWIDFSLEKSRIEAGALQSLSRDLTDERFGTFVQADAVVVRHLRAIVGGRLDTSKLTDNTTLDPRLSLAWEPQKNLSFSVGGGTYHQVPDGYYFLDAAGARLQRPAIRAQDAIAAVEYRHDLQVFRLEAYQKHYGALAQMDRNHLPVPNAGVGSARGVDLFFKTPLPGDFSGRVTCSFVETERTDPNTGRLAPAPWDITHSVSVIVERTFFDWHTSLGWRYATGRPLTPVIGATRGSSGEWQPVYGDPYSSRVKPLQRFDLLLYRVWPLKAGRSVTTYVSVNNLFNRANIYGYRYSEDYSQRSNTPSLFNRVTYVGAMFNFY